MKQCLAGLLVLALGLAAPGAEPPPWTVRVEVQMVAVPMAEALEPAIGARNQATSDRGQSLPRVAEVKKRTNLRLPNGGRVLLGSSVEQPASGRVVLFLLHAVAHPPPAP